MSAYSEWKYGLISDSEYTRICNEEARRDGYLPRLNHCWEEEIWDDWSDEEEVFEDDELDEW